MLRILLMITLLFSASFAYTSKTINAYAVSLFDENMNEENIQGIHKSKKDYNGVVYTKIYALGHFFHAKPHVQIGSSKSKLFKKRAFVKNGLQIGYEMIFKHRTVRSGYLEVYVGDRLFDRSLYVK